MSKGPLYTVPGQGVKSVGDIQRDSNDHSALHRGLDIGSNREDRVYRTAIPPESELVLVQAGVTGLTVSLKAGEDNVYQSIEEVEKRLLDMQILNRFFFLHFTL